MTEETEKVQEAPAEDAKEDVKEEVEAKPEEPKKPAEAAEAESPSEPLSEIKSLLENIKLQVDKNASDIKSIKAVEDKEVKAPKLETNSKAIQENQDINGLSKEIKSVGGLSEIK